MVENYSLLKSGILEDRSQSRDWELPFYEAMNQNFLVGVGSPYGRTLEQYTQILGHNGAPDFVEFLKNKPKPIVVDAGCGSGLALGQLRDSFPGAKLIGFDNRNVLGNTIFTDNTQVKVGKLFRSLQIEFYQGSIVDIRGTIPWLYDLLICVGAFPAYTETKALQALTPYILNRFYQNLRPDGIAQIFFNPSKEIFDTTQKYLDKHDIPFSYVEADRKVLKDNFFHDKTDRAGTLMLGPKIMHPRKPKGE